MGKIHDALQRAEEQRARLVGAPPRPQVAPEDLLRPMPLEPARGSVPDFRELVERDELEPEPASKPRRRLLRRRQKADLPQEQETRAEKKARKKARKAAKPTRAEKRSESARAEKLRAARRSRVVVSASPMRVGEEYRTLRARLQSLRRIRPIRSLVVTSARPGEGKTTTAVNLALSFGLDPESRTCLVDADLRTPSVRDSFPDTPAFGLAEILESDAKLDEALIHVPDTRLSVLEVKQLPAHPSELLGSRAMIDLIDELHGRFDTIVIDAPPVLGLPDAVTLVDLCDATLLVVRAGGTPRDQVESCLDALDADKIVGTVLNRCEKSGAPYGGSSYGGR